MKIRHPVYAYIKMLLYRVTGLFEISEIFIFDRISIQTSNEDYLEFDIRSKDEIVINQSIGRLTRMARMNGALFSSISAIMD